MTCEGCQQLLLVPLPSRAAGPGDGRLCTCPGTTVALQEGAESQRLTRAGCGSSQPPGLFVCVAGFRHHPGRMPARHPGPPGVELGNSVSKAASPKTPSLATRMYATCVCARVCLRAWGWRSCSWFVPLPAAFQIGAQERPKKKISKDKGQPAFLP